MASIAVHQQKQKTVCSTLIQLLVARSFAAEIRNLNNDSHGVVVYLVYYYHVRAGI